MRRGLLLLLLLLLPLAGCPPGNLPFGNDDMPCASAGSCDMATSSPDLRSVDGGLPQVVSQPIWIGSGGSAAATDQLNVSVGGVDTAGTSNSTGGAQLTPGYFSSQTN